MNAKANYIRSRLSLRKPQTESLEILQELTDVLELKKNPDLTSELAKVRERYRTSQRDMGSEDDAVVHNMSFEGLASKHEVVTS
jgi:hypothetical protein